MKQHVNKQLSGLVGLIALASFSLNSQAVCLADVPNDWPDSRYVKPSPDNGTVTDTVTGLMWQVCSVGQLYNAGNCVGPTGTLNFNSALANALSSTFAGYDDWRLPNIKELSSLVARNCHGPAINTTAFPSTSSLVYWSNTISGGNAYTIDLSQGGHQISFARTHYRAVRYVRAGK